jgi:acetyltransferase
MLEIEQLNSSQAQASKAKLLEILADSVENGASVGFMLPLDYAEMQSYWEKIFADIGDYRVFLIAKWDGEIIGTAQLELAAKKNGSHRAEVQKLLVHSRYRGKGIAKALMEKLEEIAQAHGRTLLILDTQGGSVAESLYRRLGWIEAGQIPNFATTPIGTLEPTIFFYKELPVSC